MSEYGVPLYPAQLPTPQNIVNVSGTTTLGAGALTYNKQFLITGAGGYAITLPALDATNWPAQTFTLYNSGTALSNVTAAGSDTILFLGSSYSSVAILPGERFLVQNMGTTWVVALESGSRTTTAPQFDNSIRSASTAFVQRSLGNYQAFLTATGATTLTLAQSGSIIECGGSSTYTITLPSPTLNTTYTFICNATVSLTITASSGLIFFMGVSGSSQSLDFGTSISLVSDGTNWIVINGNGAASFAASGYQKLPSGLIMQWSKVTTAAANTPVTWTYPLSFPTAVVSVVATLINTSGATYTSSVVLTPTASAAQIQSTYTSAATYVLAIGY
jgi:hypothetical protein